MKPTKHNLLLLREANELITLVPVDDTEYQNYRDGKPVPDDVIPVYSDTQPSETPKDYQRIDNQNELTKEELDEFLKLQALLQLKNVEKDVSVLANSDFLKNKSNKDYHSVLDHYESCESDENGELSQILWSLERIRKDVATLAVIAIISVFSAVLAIIVSFIN